MPVRTYRWPALGEFRDRTKETAELEAWWVSTSRDPISLYGRRRVGKSWLCRRFAHGKPAVILVAERAVPGQQLTQMAAELAAVLDVRPQLDTVADLFTVLYDLAARRKVLVVIDEFPYLLGTTTAEQQRTLTSIQAVMERKRDGSKLKLILTGSTISQMEDLQAEKNPLHGRLRPLSLWPMPFAPATLLLHDSDVLDQLTRYSIAGGMPHYLEALAGGVLATTIARTVVDPHSQLFSEPRNLLYSELREPAVYFSILSQLAGNPQDVASVAAALRMEPKQLAMYLATLESLRLVARHRPVGAGPSSRVSQWRCTDHFIRFWFRFVQRYQSELESGADPVAHVKANVLPHLAEHTAPVFEEVVTTWMRNRYSGATEVGPWWGSALNPLRAKKERFTEEIDTVVLRGKTVAAVAEAKWTSKPMGADVLTDLIDYKLPALDQAGFTTVDTEIVLASRSGFTRGLKDLAAATPSVHLVDARDLLAALRRPSSPQPHES
ncbi:ATP-binding protein [Dermatophilaceae bacterium Soc4.6]